MKIRYYLIFLLPLIAIGFTASCKKDGGELPAAEQSTAEVDYSGPITFAQHIAPLMYRECSSCHRPGQTGPFNLLTYADAKKRAKQIVEVTRSRYMPIWLPETGHQEYVGQRVLSDAEIGAFRKWAEAGAPEGDPKLLPPAPKWASGWQLGQPDMIVTLSESYTLPASGRDEYRNFVVPVSLPMDKYVNAVEFHPNNRAVHHTFIYVDPSSGGRIKDSETPGPGFPGMDLPDGVTAPKGYFLSWQPGKTPVREPEGLGWTLAKGSDLILQMHMQTTGKPEKIRPTVGLYFTDTPPVQNVMKLGLSSIDIDIPPGKKDYRVTDSFVLPVDVQVNAILAHAHYLGKDMQGYAVLPDGTKRMLLHIPRWDFNWQGDYKFASPVFLPAGSKLVMEYVYDNSSENVNNPHTPPKRVTYGPSTTDEMAELHFQLLTPNPEDLEKLAKAYDVQAKQRAIEYRQMQVKLKPNDSMARANLGKAYFIDNRYTEAMKELEAALKLNPKNDQAYYLIGIIFRLHKQPDMALAAFQRAVASNPKNSRAYGNLGLVYLQINQLNRAEDAFRKTLQLDPNDEIAKNSLNEIQKARGGGP